MICLRILDIGIESMFVTTVGPRKGVWERIFTRISDDPDLEYLMVDGSIVRVHQHGAAKKTHKHLRQKADREAD